MNLLPKVITNLLLLSTLNIIYSWDGEHYARNSEFQYKSGLGLLKAYGEFEPTARILDIGGGIGQLGAHMAE